MHQFKCHSRHAQTNHNQSHHLDPIGKTIGFLPLDYLNYAQWNKTDAEECNPEKQNCRGPWKQKGL